MKHQEREGTRPAAIAGSGRASAFLLPVLMVLAAAALVLRSRAGEEDSLRYSTVAAESQDRQAVSASVQDARRTALVRAAESVAPAVVSVNVLRRETVRPRSLFEQFFLGPGEREIQGLGSGLVIDARGYVLTNEHVVRGASEIVVTLADGRDMNAEIVGLDEVTDLALLRLTDGRLDGLPVAPLGTSSDLVIGEWVVAIGNPFGYLLSNPEPTVTAGVVSGLRRNIIPGDGTRGYYLDMIQTDASINPGNSGGALVNAVGEVVGVNSSIISETGSNVGLGFAIPIDRAKRVADALLREGQVRRVWVGVEVRESEPNRFGRSQHLEVANVLAGSPAARAGIEPGMLIDSVGGYPIHSTLDWEARLLDTGVGETLTIAVTDGDRRRRLQVATQDLPSITAERVRAGSDFEFISLTPAIRAERGLVSEAGALIVSLSPAARDLGLREGDLVTEINRIPVSTAQEVAAILRRQSSRGGAVRMGFERRGRYGAVSFYIGR